VPQVADVAGRSLVFRYGADGRKDRVPVAESRALVTRVAAGELGPNVLLRPVVERAILRPSPTPPARGSCRTSRRSAPSPPPLGASAPLAVPRWSCTVLEPQVARVLARYGLRAADLAQPDAAESRLAREAVPAPAHGALEACGTPSRSASRAPPARPVRPSSRRPSPRAPNARWRTVSTAWSAASWPP
jgi:hypothetical protein